MDAEKDRKFQMKKQKILDEIESIKRMRALGIHPLDAVDEMMEMMVQLLKTRILKESPNATEEEIKQKMRELIDLNLKVRNSSRRRQTHDAK